MSNQSPIDINLRVTKDGLNQLAVVMAQWFVNNEPVDITLSFPAKQVSASGNAPIKDGQTINLHLMDEKTHDARF